MTESHTVPYINESLVSTCKFCDAGYRVEYTNENCERYKGNDIVLQGRQDRTNEFMEFPIKEKTIKKPRSWQ